MEVEYELQGPDRKRCGNCQHSQTGATNVSAGKRFGNEVLAVGACTVFTLR